MDSKQLDLDILQMNNDTMETLVKVLTLHLCLTLVTFAFNN